MCSIYKNYIFLYGIKVSNLTSNFRYYQWPFLLLPLILLWNLSQQLNYPLNYLLQIIPPGTRKLLYCWLQIMYSAISRGHLTMLGLHLSRVTDLSHRIFWFWLGWRYSWSQVYSCLSYLYVLWKIKRWTKMNKNEHRIWEWKYFLCFSMFDQK